MYARASAPAPAPGPTHQTFGRRAPLLRSYGRGVVVRVRRGVCRGQAGAARRPRQWSAPDPDHHPAAHTESKKRRRTEVRRRFSHAAKLAT